MMPAYLEQGLLKRNPFETIDQTGVGELVRMGAERGRGDEAEAEARRVRRARRRPRDRSSCSTTPGSTTVSCSPFRVPIARLAAAQAVIASAQR